MYHFRQWLWDSVMRVSGWISVGTMIAGAALSYSAAAKRYSDAHSIPTWSVFALGVAVFLFASFRAWSEEHTARERTEEKVFPTISIDRLEDSEPDTVNPILKIWFCITNNGEYPAEKVSCHLSMPPGRSASPTGRQLSRELGILSPKDRYIFAMDIDVIDRHKALTTWAAVISNGVPLRIQGILKYTTQVTMTDKANDIIFDLDLASRTFLPISRDATPKKRKKNTLMNWIVGASG